MEHARLGCAGLHTRSPADYLGACRIGILTALAGLCAGCGGGAARTDDTSTPQLASINDLVEVAGCVKDPEDSGYSSFDSGSGFRDTGSFFDVFGPEDSGDTADTADTADTGLQFDTSDRWWEPQTDTPDVWVDSNENAASGRPCRAVERTNEVQGSGCAESRSALAVVIGVLLFLGPALRSGRSA